MIYVSQHVRVRLVQYNNNNNKNNQMLINVCASYIGIVDDLSPSESAP